jgi:geranylgeranyl reductase family protein
MLSADVVVVGLGPAGAAAAIHLARAGRHVLAIDRARFPRDKCCGDGLTTAALRELADLGFDPATVPSWQPVDDVVLRSPSGRELDLALPRGQGAFAAVARRADFDAALVRMAEHAGAVVAEGHALVGAEVANDHVVLDVEGLGSVAARYVIGADGMWSPLRRALGLVSEAYLGEWHAFRQYFRDVSPRARRELMVWFEPDLLPGYAWSFPLPAGGANVGFGIRRGGTIPTQSMKELWPELLARPHIAAFLGPDAVAEAPHRAWPIPARIGRLPLVAAAGRTLFVGDAAAATDPLTGEGIAQALVTGRLAAAAVASWGPDDHAAVGRAYRAAVGRALVADDRMSRALSTLLASSMVTRASVRLIGSCPWSRAEFARWMFEATPRAALMTPWKWSEFIREGREGAQFRRERA